MKKLAMIAAGLALVGWSGAAPGQEEQKGEGLPKGVVWKLKALDQEPLRVIRTRSHPDRVAVYWVIELTRDFDVYEDGAYWGPAFKAGRPRFRFELTDADGVLIKTIDARYVSQYVNQAGKRFGVYFELPTEDKDLALRTRTIEAVIK